MLLKDLIKIFECISIYTYSSLSSNLNKVVPLVIQLRQELLLTDYRRQIVCMLPIDRKEKDWEKSTGRQAGRQADRQTDNIQMKSYFSFLYCNAYMSENVFLLLTKF